MRNLVIAVLFTLCVTSGCSTPGQSSGNPSSSSAQPTSEATRPPATKAVIASAPVARPRATGTAEDARRHMVRGMAAVEMAKSSVELEDAAEEFRMATEIAPNMAAAWFNLATLTARMNRYEEAIAAYNHYLALSPNADDASRVRDEVIKLQYRQEKIAKIDARAGTWVTEDGTIYTATIEDNRLVLKGQGHVSLDEVTTSYPPIGPRPPEPAEDTEYRLVMQGNQLSGNWTRAPLRRGKCTVPPETTEAQGEIDDRSGILLLRHARTQYHAVTRLSLLQDDYCSEVTVTGKKMVEERVYGPLPHGGLGVTVVGLGTWWFEGFEDSRIHGWQGRMGVSVAADSAAYAAGLRDRDEILTIDGVEVRTLTAGQAVRRLRGEPDSTVTLTVLRRGQDAAVTVFMKRIPLEKSAHN